MNSSTLICEYLRKIYIHLREPLRPSEESSSTSISKQPSFEMLPVGEDLSEK